MSYRLAFLILIGMFVLYFSRILFLGEVIFPHSNAVEAGAVSGERGDAYRSNRKFSDQASFFIPELTNNLGLDRKAWLQTWNPHVELGRPVFHGELSRAFALTNLLSCFTSNAFVLYTALVLLTAGLTGAFLLLFLRSLGLHPAACGCAALGLGFATMVSYWLCFVMFLSAICWPVCLLWLITEFTRKRSWPVAFGLAFATYCLLISGYPQVTILSAYLIGPYALIKVGQMPGGRGEKLRTMVAMLACVGASVLASLPLYLDLLVMTKDSARLGEVNDSFFLGALPPSQTMQQLASFLMTLFDWSWLGNAMDPKYPLPTFNGVSFTPMYGSLAWLSLLLKNRRALWLWQLFVLACIVATIFPTVYLFAVHHLGFGLSPIQLLGGAIIPGFVLSAFTVDAILRGELRLTIRSVAWLLVPVALEGATALFVWRPLPINVSAVWITLLLIAALLGASYWRCVPAFVGLAVFSVLLYGRPLILSRPLQTIHISSKLIDTISALTRDGSRFAISDRAIKAELPPNEEVLFDLTSVNSYDSLSSRRYHELVHKWSPNRPLSYARHFKLLDSESALADPAFPLSNVKVILSKRPLETEPLKLVAEVNGIKLYQPLAAPISLLQTDRYSFSSAGQAGIEPVAAQQNLPSRRVQRLNDFQRIELTSSPQKTLLFLSQQYHPAWRASSQGQPLRTVMVNNFYQGVIVPPHTSEVELFFHPFILWSWLPQLVFAVTAASLLVRAILARRARHFHVASV